MAGLRGASVLIESLVIQIAQDPPVPLEAWPTFHYTVANARAERGTPNVDHAGQMDSRDGARPRHDRAFRREADAPGRHLLWPVVLWLRRAGRPRLQDLHQCF